MKHNLADHNQIEMFYYGGEVTLTEYGMHDGAMQLSTRDTVMSDAVKSLTEVAIDAKLEELDLSTQVVESNGRHFEIVMANMDADPGHALFQGSTYSSCIAGRRGNPGNAYELAVQAALYPDVRLVYGAALGNGGSGGLDRKERRHYTTTGRLTDEDDMGRTIALPIVQALGGALQSIGINVTRLGDDSAGGRLTTALGVDLPEGQVTATFHNGIPNMYDHTRRSVVRAMLIRENIFNGRRNAATSTDHWKVTPRRVGHARGLMPRVYSDMPTDLHIEESSTPAMLRKLWSDADALRIGPRGGDPLARDTAGFVRQQPESHTTFLMSQYDPLYLGNEFGPRAYDLLGKIAVDGNASPVVWQLDGMTHAFHTYYPSLYHSIKADGLQLA
jgi:hypothetical protein